MIANSPGLQVLAGARGEAWAASILHAVAGAVSASAGVRVEVELLACGHPAGGPSQWTLHQRRSHVSSCAGHRPGILPGTWRRAKRVLEDAQGQLRSATKVCDGDLRVWLNECEADAPPLLLEWKDMVYTDGSFIPPAQLPPGAPGLGASCYVPDGGPRSAVQVRVDPRDMGGQKNTIFRAEAVALLYALHVARSAGGPARIATDSLSAMSLVRRSVHSRHDIVPEHWILDTGYYP